MIVIENFDNVSESGLNYGGHSGSKRGIVIDGERWFLKFPKNTKDMNKVNISYTTSPLSEYLGSHIYEMIGIDTHETKLGVVQNKLVVACKDFLNYGERIEDYNMIKNYESKEISLKLENLPSSTSEYKEELNVLKVIMEENPTFINNPLLKTRFWDMFIVDAFIGNSDRNEGNWGIIIDTKSLDTRICPVFDNGASFYNKHDDVKMKDILNSDEKFKNSSYLSSSCPFTIYDKTINPLRYIEAMEDIDCNQAVIRIVPKIDIKQICEFLDSIPEEYEGIEVFSKTRKEFYKKVLYYRYENTLLKVYNKLKEEA